MREAYDRERPVLEARRAELQAEEAALQRKWRADLPWLRHLLKCDRDAELASLVTDADREAAEEVGEMLAESAWLLQLIPDPADDSAKCARELAETVRRAGPGFFLALAEWLEAWAEGRAMTVERLTAYALEENGEPPRAEAYCVKCKKKVEMKSPQHITMKNGRPGLKGTCSNCGTGVFTIVVGK